VDYGTAAAMLDRVLKGTCPHDPDTWHACHVSWNEPAE